MVPKVILLAEFHCTSGVAIGCLFTATVVVRLVEGTGTKEDDIGMSACVEEGCKKYLANKSDENLNELDSESAKLITSLEQGRCTKIRLAYVTS